MKPDISELSVDELKRLQEEAEALIASKKDQAIEDAYNQILAVAEAVGFTVEELLEYGEQKRKKTWTGRGKQPRWLVAELEKGAKLEDFLI